MFFPRISQIAEEKEITLRLILSLSNGTSIFRFEDTDLIFLSFHNVLQIFCVIQLDFKFLFQLFNLWKATFNFLDMIIDAPGARIIS
jgi:hypothetical protein